MIDTKKRERFLSSFNAVEKDILDGFVNTLSSTNSDIYLVMARKATCLIEALVELGSLSLNGKVYFERILDLDQDFLQIFLKIKRLRSLMIQLFLGRPLVMLSSQYWIMVPNML